jgi:hypothetical protein
MAYNPFQQPEMKSPNVVFLECISAGHTDKAAAGLAGWTIEEGEAFAKSNEREYQIADNKRQHTYELYLMGTGRGVDIARVALKQETKSWVPKAEPMPVKILEDYVD